MRIVVVLPAPLGPRKPKTSPRPTLKSTASTARRSPNRLVSPRASMRTGEGADSADAAVGVGRMAWVSIPQAYGRPAGDGGAPAKNRGLGGA